MDWSDWQKPRVVISLIGAAVVFFGATCFLGYTIFYRVPDLEKRVEKMDSNTHDGMKTLSDDLRGQLQTMNGDLHEQLKTMGIALSGLKANVMLLCTQKHSQSGACNMQTLIAEAKSASRIQAQLFDTASVTLTRGLAPIVASEDLLKGLPEITFGSAGITYTYPSDEGKRDIGDVILWSSAAESAYWYQEGGEIKATFKNGDATFQLAPSTSKEHAVELVDSLNATAEALRAGESSKNAQKK